MKSIQFQIPDLHCESCAERSTNILQRLEGVQNASVTFENKSAEVVFDSDKVSYNDIKEALAKANYTAKKYTNE